MNYKITFQFEDGDEPVVAYGSEDENILEIAQKVNVAIDAPCGGNAACGKCRIRLVDGDLDTRQTSHFTDKEYAQGWRLSCVSKPLSDVAVMVPDIASAYKSRMKVADLSSPGELSIFKQMKNDLIGAGIVFSNDLDIVRVSMNEPTVDDTMPDTERLIWALKDAVGLDDCQVDISFPVLRELSFNLRKYSFCIDAIISRTNGRLKVLDIRGPEDINEIAGLAIDIGTTTVSAVLVDMKTGNILSKASAGNAQIRYGADVINRIIESMKNGGRKKLHDAIVYETINPMIEKMAEEAGTRPDQIYRLSIAGNTTMNHLLCGVYANPIRMEPYVPTFFEAPYISACDLGIRAWDHASVRMTPNIGSYVGGDITAGTLASCIWNRETMSLFIDLGTNGELVFGNNEFMMGCACSAGPAFEGGDISCGMRATDGAIESINIDKNTMEPEFSIIGGKGQKAVGVCGSGLIDLVCELFRCGIINPKGKFEREGERIRHDKYGMGSYVIVQKEQASSVKDIEINEVDIDNFIRAKGAIFSAIRTMLKSLDFTVDMIDDVYVAGGIGSGINMRNAVSIGMFPDIGDNKFHYIGNSSLSGAYSVLLSMDAENKVREIARNITYLELSNVSGYMDEFVACCFLPHTDASLFPSFTFK